MSVIVHLTAIKDHLRDHLDKNVCKKVDFYAGEFDEKEVKRISFTAPAVFVSCLGWRQTTDKTLGAKGMDLRVLLYVVTKSAKSRIARMKSAVLLTEKVQSLLEAKIVASDCNDARAAHTFNVENLYSEKLDKQGLALWVMSYWYPVTKDHGDLDTLLAGLVDVTDFEMSNGDEDIAK